MLASHDSECGPRRLCVKPVPYEAILKTNPAQSSLYVLDFNISTGLFLGIRCIDSELQNDSARRPAIPYVL